MVMFPLSEKKINFHCHPDLINNWVQVRRKWAIITQWALSLSLSLLSFVPTSEQEWRGSGGGSWGLLVLVADFCQDPGESNKKGIGHWLLANSEREGQRKKHLCYNFLSSKNAYPLMHVIKAIELKSLLVERHGIWKMGSLQPEL